MCTMPSHAISSKFKALTHTQRYSLEMVEVLLLEGSTQPKIFPRIAGLPQRALAVGDMYAAAKSHALHVIIALCLDGIHLPLD